MNRQQSPAALEARIAARLAAALTLNVQDIPHDISERLRFAREQALLRAGSARMQAAGNTANLGVSSQGWAVLGGSSAWWQRLTSVLPLVVLVSGMLMIDRWNSQEQILAAAEIDAQLLSDALPPAAYSDPGFAEFLKNNAAP